MKAVIKNPVLKYHKLNPVHIPIWGNVILKYKG